jgi:ElaB/YqjD/DUF883 family membrane-anchored ribosome-binding protein
MKRMDQGVMETAAAAASSVAEEFSNTVHGAGELGRAAGRLAGQTVQDHPWRAIGLAVGVGFLIGLLARRH